MHTLLEVSNGPNGSSHVPAFLVKLWKIVDDPKTNELICWSEMGNSFLIRNQPKFARDLLPLYYKHNNMASFVRQLNMYGFHKVVSVDQGGLKTEKDEMEFAHPFFLKGSESTLELIKRKIPAAKLEDSRGSRPDTINKVLLDVRQMKGRQDSMDNKLLAVKRENEALWRELSLLRQKHAKQQQIVSKLLQFLVGMMSSQSHRISFKRRMPMNMPLMLSDSDGLKSAKRNKKSGEFGGPVIRDVTDFMSANDRMLENQDFSCPASDSDTHPKVDSPGSSLPDRSPYSESVYPLSPYEDPDLLLSVDPMSMNPSVEIQSRQPVPQPTAPAQALPSIGKTPQKKTKASRKGAKSQSGSNIAATVGTGFMQGPTTSQTSTRMNTDTTKNSNVPVMYIPDTTTQQPVQVVLSLPEPVVPSMVEAKRTEQTLMGPSTSAAHQVINPGQQLAPNNISVQLTQSAPTALADTQHDVLLSDPVSAMNVLGSENDANTEMVLSEIPLSRHQALSSSKLLSSSLHKEDFDGHLGDVQSGLDNLRELLKHDQYTIDQNTLLQLFGSDDLLPEIRLKTEDTSKADVVGAGGNSTSGEMVTYNPSLYELADDGFDYQNNGFFLDDELESMLTTDRDKLNKGDLSKDLTL